MKISLDINYSDFEKSLRAAGTRVGIGAGKIVEEDAERIMEESRSECPTDTGALLEGAFIDVEKGMLNGKASFGYSGETINPETGQSTSEYMIKVHEDLTANHPVGKAKFLEDPVNRYTHEFDKTIAGKISKILGD